MKNVIETLLYVSEQSGIYEKKNCTKAELFCPIKHMHMSYSFLELDGVYITNTI